MYVALYLTGQGCGHRILTGAVAAMLFLETLNANVLVTDLYTSNRLDQNYVMNVEAQVEKYERETGILVQKVGICTAEDWDSFDAEEQMIFDGDTLYIALY